MTNIPKHVIALLIEDARRLQAIEPSAERERYTNVATAMLNETPISESARQLYQASKESGDEEVITVYGHKVNRQFAFYMLDKFNPTFCRIIEELTLRGMDKKSIEDATTAASSAAVVGVNSLMAIALNQQNQKESRSPAD